MEGFHVHKKYYHAHVHGLMHDGVMGMPIMPFNVNVRL